MRYIAAYTLATLGGNSQPKAEDLKAILEAVGISADDVHLNNVVTALQGKDLGEVIASGKTKLATVPSGGSQAAAPVSNTAASDSKPAAKKEEPKEESDDDMGFGLFD